MRATCRICQDPIIFALVGNREGRPPSRMPLNPQPDPAGNVAVYRDAQRTLVGRVLGKDDHVLGYERLMMPHFATCAKPEPPAKPPPLPDGVASIDTYRKTRHTRILGRRRPS